MEYYSATKSMKFWYMHNMDEPWKHRGKWKKPDTKYHIFYDLIPLTWNIQNKKIQRQKAD